MMSRADTELIVLQQQAQELQAKLQAAHAEIGTLQARSASRLQAAETARQSVESLRADVMRAQAQNIVTQGTLAAGNEPSPRDLTRFLQKASADHAAILARNQVDQAKDSAIILRLEADIQTWTQRLYENISLQGALATTREQAIADLGQCEYDEVETRLNELHADLAAKESAVTYSVAALENYSEEAWHRLEQWPELQAQAKALFLPYQDEVTHVLEAAATLYDALLSEGPRARVDPTVLRQVHRWASDLSDLLWLEQRDLWPVLPNGHLDEARTIRDRKVQLGQLLKLYREKR